MTTRPLPIQRRALGLRLIYCAQSAKNKKLMAGYEEALSLLSKRSIRVLRFWFALS